MAQVRIRSMTPSDVPAVVKACADWQELVQHGPPYWRPRATAELERKIAAMSGPTPATEYTFVIEAGGRLVGECSLHAIDWRSRYAQVSASASGHRRIVARATVAGQSPSSWPGHATS